MTGTEWTVTAGAMPDAITDLRRRFDRLLRRVHDSGYEGITTPALVCSLLERGLMSFETELDLEQRTDDQR